MSSFLQRITLLAVLLTVSMLSVACESSQQPKRRKAVPPSSDLSGIPWNRPTKAEGAGRFGSMVPQSR